METREKNCVSTEEDDSHGNADSAEKTQTQADALANGLSSILSTVILDFDSKAQDTLRSQNHLSSALDRLTGGTL